MKITAAMLEKHGAREEEVKVFRREWPKGAVVNKKNALRAVELELDVGWLATNLLSVAVWALYRKARDAASAAYRKAVDAAWSQYQKAEAGGAALAACRKAQEAAWAEHYKAVALAFVDAVKKMENKRD